MMNFLKATIIFSSILFLFSCSNNNTFVIEGKITDAANKTIYLEELNLDGTSTVDSIEINKKGQFKFSLPRLEYPSFFLLKLDDKNFITLLGDTTENIGIEAEMDSFVSDYSVKNSMGSSYVKTLNRKLDLTTSGLDSLSNVYNATDKDDVEKRKALIEDIEKLVTQQKQFIYDFVMTNPRSFASYYAIFQRLNETSLILNPYDKKDQNIFSAVATSLGLLYPESPRVKQLTNFVLTIKKEQRAAATQAKLFNEAPQNIPDINEKDLDGKEHRLSDLKGKMVLVSFWASWDAESRKENLRLKKIYDKYKSKGFVVYQVSLDRSKILWEEAIEKDALPWINVSDLQYTASRPARTYNIQRLPANYLISKDQEIIGKDLFGRILDEKLNELLK
ncbi:TlpA disulfide reductase family protein [Saccharicrinis aurantiacus]|uniref:TlpA disulfide reductase family protein n=1 Tax=Saccharicrinis aurantiacus TaxID=1849719 RepID=UPI00094FA750|nr:TlpA disulfide reductase family protein [Saccharicrinis aurantiacus]